MWLVGEYGYLKIGWTFTPRGRAHCAPVVESIRTSLKLAASQFVSVPLGPEREGKSQVGSQCAGVGAVGITARSKVSSWPPVRWCRCRLDFIATESLTLAASELVSEPLGLQRETNSQAGRQCAGVGAVGTTARSIVSNWPPVRWCRCRWDIIATETQVGRQCTGVGAVGITARSKV